MPCWREQNKVAYITNSHRSVSPVGNTNQRMGQTRTSGYTRGGIRCQGGESIPCLPITPADHENGTNRSQDQCVENGLRIGAFLMKLRFISEKYQKEECRYFGFKRKVGF
jgi:hypothetical protein